MRSLRLVATAPKSRTWPVAERDRRAAAARVRRRALDARARGRRERHGRAERAPGAAPRGVVLVNLARRALFAAALAGARRARAAASAAPWDAAAVGRAERDRRADGDARAVGQTRADGDARSRRSRLAPTATPICRGLMVQPQRRPPTRERGVAARRRRLRRAGRRVDGRASRFDARTTGGGRSRWSCARSTTTTTARELLRRDRRRRQREPRLALPARARRRARVRRARRRSALPPVRSRHVRGAQAVRGRRGRGRLARRALRVGPRPANAGGQREERGWDARARNQGVPAPRARTWTADDDFYEPYASRVTSAAMCARQRERQRRLGDRAHGNASGHALVAAEGRRRPRRARARPRGPPGDRGARNARPRAGDPPRRRQRRCGSRAGRARAVTVFVTLDRSTRRRRALRRRRAAATRGATRTCRRRT